MSAVTTTTSATTSSGSRQTGTVVKWLNHRGIGFITPDGQDTSIGKDLLVHHAHIKQENAKNGFKTIEEGSRVEFETTQDPKQPSKLIAINVTGIGGGDCEPRTSRPGNNHRKSLYDEDADDKTIFIYGDWKNTTKKITWRDLKDHFSSVGYVKRADLIPTKGYGIVRFATVEEAQSAVDKFNSTEFYGQAIQVRATKTDEDEESSD